MEHRLTRHGSTVGLSVGAFVGARLGLFVMGSSETVGTSVGTREGRSEGLGVGVFVGLVVESWAVGVSVVELSQPPTLGGTARVIMRRQVQVFC